MVSSTLQKLIDAALKDGVITDSERTMLHRRAEKEGMSADELDSILDEELKKRSSTAGSSQTKEDKPSGNSGNVAVSSRPNHDNKAQKEKTTPTKEVVVTIETSAGAVHDLYPVGKEQKEDIECFIDFDDIDQITDILKGSSKTVRSYAYSEYEPVKVIAREGGKVVYEEEYSEAMELSDFDLCSENLAKAKNIDKDIKAIRSKNIDGCFKDRYFSLFYKAGLKVGDAPLVIGHRIDTPLLMTYKIQIPANEEFDINKFHIMLLYQDNFDWHPRYDADDTGERCADVILYDDTLYEGTFEMTGNITKETTWVTKDMTMYRSLIQNREEASNGGHEWEPSLDDVMDDDDRNESSSVQEEEPKANTTKPKSPKKAAKSSRNGVKKSQNTGKSKRSKTKKDQSSLKKLAIAAAIILLCVLACNALFGGKDSHQKARTEQTSESQSFQEDDETYTSSNEGTDDEIAIDPNGDVQEQLRSKYDIVSTFEGNFYKIGKDSKYGLASKDGEIIVKPKYDYIFSIDKETNFIKVKIDEKFGFLNSEGKEVCAPKYDYIFSIDKWTNLIKVKTDEKFGFLNSAGKEVCKPQYSYVYSVDKASGLMKVEKNGKFGFYNPTTQQEVAPCKYDYIYSLSGGLYKVEANGKTGYLNKDGSINKELE